MKKAKEMTVTEEESIHDALDSALSNAPEFGTVFFSVLFFQGKPSKINSGVRESFLMENGKLR